LSTVRVRFAPSPTGYLHVGGLRTALYNYLFAKKHQGDFLLRIEDTDRTRLVEGAVENLIRTLAWAGLQFDEGPGTGGDRGPYVQSERLTIYRDHAETLVRGGHAYYAFDTAEELEQMKAEQESQKLTPRYDRRALKLSAAEIQEKRAAGIPCVVRLRVPDATTVVIDDVVRGRVEFESAMIDDQVLLKSDGFPTYHLANVVDDHLMGITHVIRGEEWLSSTPKHVLLYQAFGWELPVFAHLPLLLNPDRSKLSKRQGDVAVEDYMQKGYLPEALLNFIAFLGWNPGDEREIFSLEALVTEFSLERVGKSGAVFNIEKLNSVNKHYIKNASARSLVAEVRSRLVAHGMTIPTDEYIWHVIEMMRERVATTEEFITGCPYFFSDPDSYDEEARKKNWKPETAGWMRDLLPTLLTANPFTTVTLESIVKEKAGQLGVGAGKLIHPLRLAVSGTSKGPGLFEMMDLLGRETCKRRIERAMTLLG
jgi:glutamyl-tRNA synthetase